MNDEKPIVRGLLSLSNRGPVAGLAGRNGVMIAGIVSMPAEMAEVFACKSWSQRLVTGNTLMDEILLLHIERDVVNDLKEELMTGARVDQLLTHPGIWRV